jgi:hypothetical protein
MLDSTWRLVYDATQAEPSGVVFPAVGVALVVIAVVRLRRPIARLVSAGERAALRRRRVWFLIGALAWASLAALLVLGPHRAEVAALRADRATRVEGLVEDYEAGSYARKRPERWTVAGHRYEFRPYSGRPGFDALGVVHPGQRVRIADVNGWIARLEVAE